MGDLKKVGRVGLKAIVYFEVLTSLALVIGLLVLVSSLGIQITPILTALGVGGLAVALALAVALHLAVERPFMRRFPARPPVVLGVWLLWGVIRSGRI